jgi:FG-GAP repeat
MAKRSRKQHLRWLCLAQALMLSTPVPASSPGTVAPRTVSFIARRDFAAGINPQSVVVGDFNGDGVPDLAVANFGSSSVSVLLGRGDGTGGAGLRRW